MALPGPGRADRDEVLRVLRADGPLLVGADESGPDAPVLRTIRLVRQRGYRGLIVAPCGPSVSFSAAEPCE